jgi:deoxyribonuclease-4
MLEIGLKLWSSNTGLHTEIIDLYKKGYFSYIELFTVPESKKTVQEFWKKLDIPYVIHAAHSLSGLNFSKSEMQNKNLMLADEAKYFADELNADYIIFHPGTDGELKETIRQINLIKDNRFLIENKPAVGLNGEKCIGSTIQEIRTIIDESGCKFCLDFGHAIAAANTHKIEPLQYCKDFMQLNPVLFHLTDGEYNSDKDHHYHYGHGTFPLANIFCLIPDASFVTNEAKRDDQDSLKEIIRDTDYTKSFFI